MLSFGFEKQTNVTHDARQFIHNKHGVSIGLFVSFFALWATAWQGIRSSIHKRAAGKSLAVSRDELYSIEETAERVQHFLRSLNLEKDSHAYTCSDGQGNL